MTFEQEVESRIVRRDGKFGYDKDGNVIHYLRKTGTTIYEGWKEFDKDGNEIHSKHTVTPEYSSVPTSGYETWTEYNEQRLQTHSKVVRINGEDFEEWFEYNEDGRNTYYKNTEGAESWMEYDQETGEKVYHAQIDNGDFQPYVKLGYMEPHINVLMDTRE